MTNRFLMWGWFDGSIHISIHPTEPCMWPRVSVSCEIDSQKSVHDSIRGKEMI